jgi:hypothetical protein
VGSWFNITAVSKDIESSANSNSDLGSVLMDGLLRQGESFEVAADFEEIDECLKERKRRENDGFFRVVHQDQSGSLIQFKVKVGV